MLDKINKKKIKYKLRMDTIENLKKTLGVEGKGTQDSPLIFENIRDFAEISLRIKKPYIKLRRLSISKLSIIDSENVIIEDCIINELEIIACSNLKFIRNHIDSVKHLLCRNCYFEDNGFSGGFSGNVYSKLINNTYERRTFIFVWICFIVGLLYSLFGVISLVYLYLSLDTIVFLIVGIILSLAMIYMLSLRFRLRKIPQNKYISYHTKVKDESIAKVFEIE